MATEAGYDRSLGEVEATIENGSALSGFLFVGLDETEATATAGVNPDVGEFDVAKALGLLLAASSKMADVEPEILGHAAIESAREQAGPDAVQIHDGGSDLDGDD